MASTDTKQLYEALRKADAAGDTAAAQRFAERIKAAKKGDDSGEVKLEESPTSFGNLLGAAVEPLLSMGSNAVLQPVAGLAGAASAPFVGADEAANLVRKIQGVGYEPHSVGGQNAMKVLGAIPQAIDTGATKAGEVVGDVTGSPLLAAGTKTALEGASTLLGAKGLGAASEEASLGIGKPLDPAVADLINRGVTVTHGQRMGGAANALEQKLTSLPLVGDVIKRARGRATEQYNVADMNEALQSAGGRAVPQGMVGQDALRHTYQELQQRYSDTLSHMHGDLDKGVPSNLPAVPGQPTPPSTGSLRQRLTSLRGLAQNIADETVRNRVNDTIDKQVLGRFAQSGKATGETIQKIMETVRKEEEALRRSSSTGGNAYTEGADALKQVRAEIDDMLVRQNPRLAEQYKNVRKGFAQFGDASRASKKGVKTEGVYTPAQKLQTIRAREDRKGRQHTFSTGTAAGQQRATAAERVLGNTVPDSGTTGRALATGALMEGGGLGALLAGHPGLAALSAASPAIYSQWLLDAINRARVAGRSPLGTAAATALPIGAEAEQQKR